MPRPGSAVARVKRTLTQRNFTLGELKEDFLEGDDLEARLGERCDVPPPDALGLGAAVEQEQGRAAGSLVDVGQLRAGGQRRSLTRWSLVLRMDSNP